MSLMAAITGIVDQVLPGIAKSIFPNPEDELKRRELEHRIPLALLEHSAKIEEAAGAIIKQEAASSHWLAANWRPLTMVTFVTLIVARFLGWTAPGLSEAEVLRLWDIIHLGLGGYVIGRSAEKVTPILADALKGHK